MLRFFFLTFGLVLCSCSIAHAQKITDKNSKLLKSYIEKLNRDMRFSGVVLIGKGDSVLFEKSIGLASIEHNAPLEMDARLKMFDNYNLKNISHLHHALLRSQLV